MGLAQAISDGVLTAFKAVAERNLYLERLHATQSIGEVTRIIETFRAELPEVRPWEGIPL